MEGTHEGIVSRETWELAQQIREQRRNKKIAGSKKPVYPFTSMIECGCCGKHYQHKVNNMLLFRTKKHLRKAGAFSVIFARLPMSDIALAMGFFCLLLTKREKSDI